MFKTVWGKVIALAAVGAAGLLVGGFVVSAFLPHSALAGNMMGGVSTVTSPSISTTRVVNEPSATGTAGQDALREQAARMLQEHMGLSQQDAVSEAATMADHMQQAHGDQAADILKQCTDNAGDMMKGVDASGTMGSATADSTTPGTLAGGGVMGGGSHESHHNGAGTGIAPGAPSQGQSGLQGSTLN
jgi:hypothetical protein